MLNQSLKVTVNLIEHLAERIAKRINSHYNRVMETKVRITKENPPIRVL